MLNTYKLTFILICQ